MISNEKRITIGCLLGQFDENYNHEICTGISNYAKKNDINVIYYAGRSLNKPNPSQMMCNVIFDLTHSNIIDGLVIISGTVGLYINNEEFRTFVQDFQDFPLVSIGIEIPDQISVLVDNEKGMHEAISHLITCHNLRRIAFIQGPEGHPEAEARFSAYKTALEENDIDFDPNLVTPGDFNGESGVKAIQLLIDEKNVEFEAIVAVNDTVANSVLLELKNRKISVPNDIAVIGFDDLTQSKNLDPPLTTVRQPLNQLGEKASEILFKKIKNQVVPQIIMCYTDMVVRRLCGVVPQ